MQRTQATGTGAPVRLAARFSRPPRLSRISSGKAVTSIPLAALPSVCLSLPFLRTCMLVRLLSADSAHGHAPDRHSGTQKHFRLGPRDHRVAGTRTGDSRVAGTRMQAHPPAPKSTRISWRVQRVVAVRGRRVGVGPVHKSAQEQLLDSPSALVPGLGVASVFTRHQGVLPRRHARHRGARAAQQERDSPLHQAVPVIGLARHEPRGTRISKA